jgi:hypothetical protein
VSSNLKEDFLEWRNNAITKKMVGDFQSAVEALKEILAIEAGIDSKADQYKVATIAAIRDLLDWKPEGLEPEENE